MAKKISEIVIKVREDYNSKITEDKLNLILSSEDFLFILKDMFAISEHDIDSISFDKNLGLKVSLKRN